VSDLIGAGTAETIVFIAATVLAIASALGVVLSGNPFRSALWLILNLVSLATFYLLLSADFLAAAQVIVYAGAVMIMFLFVIAYLGGAADEPSRDTPAWQLAAALIAGGALVVEVVIALASHEFGGAPDVAANFGGAESVSGPLFGTYLLGFEVASVVLLVAAVGGVVLGARRPAPRGADEAEPFPERVRTAPEPELQTLVMGAETTFPVRHVRPKEDGR
jgi:NADH-quinone oxidoreductase subunit J